MTLSEEQQQIFNLYSMGENIFLSGAAGSGKSFLINEIQKNANLRRKKIAITAMTGCAAVLLENATTLHSWGGIFSNYNQSEEEKYNFSSRKASNWKNIDILVIDEVSMLDSILFEEMDMNAKKQRSNQLSFGGIQMILSGDFYQLPPIEGNFCFTSVLWNLTFKPKTNQVFLKKNFRQAQDHKYREILTEIRDGKLSDLNYDLINSRHGALDLSAKEPICIVPLKKSANFINDSENQKLNSAISNTYFRKNYYNGVLYAGKIDKKTIFDSIMKQRGTYEEKIELRVGSKVMCLQNLDFLAGIVNGSQGIVSSFIDGNPNIKFSSGLERIILPIKWTTEEYPSYHVEQIPLTLAWAITIHKSQGMTLDYAKIDIGSSIFAPGQIYTAMSRIKTLNGLYLRNKIDRQKIGINKDVLNFYKNFCV